MNVPGLTRYHVASHLQKFRERKVRIKKPRRRYNFHLERDAGKKYGHSTSSHNDACIIPFTRFTSLPKPSTLNSTGISFMNIDNIKAKLQGAPPLHIPRLTTTNFWFDENQILVV